MQTPGPVLTPWREKVAAVANLFLGGEETANAWAAVLFGDVSPSGKLPISMPASAADATRSPNLRAAYPFGYGLSYASFKVENLNESTCNSVTCILVNVVNTHTKFAGRETVQAYTRFRPEVGEPRMLLKSWAKTGVLKPGASEEVRLMFHGWVPQPGAEVQIGFSSKDIRHTVTFNQTLNQTL